ncbi:GIY-YIG nuclease family protein [Bacillus thermotolerans]|uniref:Endonuclease n=1 Tax=Bacillus thermotolerans TaxID=1221996 RepID=A0A0F5HR40_BACTR|nr:GIY-YIG nuclease family protein [Bacillus thermotolerans]KKB35307.1 putative endonuclease [Bacillus thermotolerans]KKB39385.1 putative endonuclease [Bacillus thermotolerans]KKB42820.1 putative endonuclease [Bacillus thermotolerans]
MEKNNNHFFYVLKCRDQSFYAGYTNNLERRIAAHNAGKGAKYTRSRRPVQLIHAEVFPTITEAMRAEYAFKQLTRPQKIKYLQREGSHCDCQAEQL